MSSHSVRSLKRTPTLTAVLQVATKISNALGRDIVHVKLSDEEVVKRYEASGLPEFMAKFLTFLEVETGKGMEERSDDSVERVTGRPALNFNSWVQQNKKKWE